MGAATLRRFRVRATAALLAATAILSPSLLPPRAADAQELRRECSVGYVFPAGAGRGTTVQVLAGGQNLRGASAAYVSGEGVEATVVRWVRPLSPQQMRELRLRIDEARGRRVDPKREREELPDHPLFRDLAKRDEKELRAIAARFIGPAERRQRNVQIAETVEIEVKVLADAPPGDRELRILTAAGLTNPLRFQVAGVPEVAEDDPTPGRRAETLVPSLPAVLNGQVLANDADRWRLRLAKGRRLTVETSARRLVPFLADAVPAWFQATVSLLDAKGVEVAFADDGVFEPDPVLSFVVPEGGDYVLEIRDSLWRGREDFVYRVVVDDAPGSAATTPGRGARAATDTEAGDGPDYACPLDPPAEVAGRIGQPGDTDWYVFEGKADAEIVAEVTARRTGSPLDSVLTLVDPAGLPLVWNDDHDDGAPGLRTHHADSYLRAKLPADGLYRVKVADAQRHGGPDFLYRLRIGAPVPDFEAVATPSGVSVAPGRTAAFQVRVVRKDGFAGDVEVRLAGAPPGFVLDGGRVPAARNEVRMTVTAPADAPIRPVALKLEARAVIGGSAAVRAVVPADERLQAFILHEVVPADELCLVVVPGGGRAAPPVALATEGPVRLTEGGSAAVRFRAPWRAIPPRLRFVLKEPPPGIAIAGVLPEEGGFALTLRAQPGAAKPGTAENLIVEVIEMPPPAPSGAKDPRKDAKAAKRGETPRPRSLGVLPAIEVVVEAPPARAP